MELVKPQEVNIQNGKTKKLINKKKKYRKTRNIGKIKGIHKNNNLNNIPMAPVNQIVPIAPMAPNNIKIVKKRKSYIPNPIINSSSNKNGENELQKIVANNESAKKISNQLANIVNNKLSMVPPEELKMILTEELAMVPNDNDSTMAPNIELAISNIEKIANNPIVKKMSKSSSPEKINYYNEITNFINETLKNNWSYDYSDSNINKLDISSLPDIRNLYCQKNRLENLDLSNCPELRLLACGLNKITHLDLSNVPKLEYLFCHSNEITHLDLSNCPKLKSLICANNKITGQLDVSNCLELVFIDCRDNKITELNVSNRNNIEILNFNGKIINNVKL
jgi:hypothetical protein